MKQQLEKRLKELRSEFESDQKALADLEHRQVDLRNTLLRISGAILVLEEELARENGNVSGDIGQFECVPEIKTVTE